MIDAQMYDAFSKDYDRFVNWKARLSAEIPFLKSELGKLDHDPGTELSILDAACGTGQHAIALVKAGYNCTGADFSEAMISRARENANHAGLKMTFLQAGFGQLSKKFGEDHFDGLICLGNSLPHLLDAHSLADALADFCTVLKPGGKIILQNRNFDLVLAEKVRWMPPQTFREGEETMLYARFYDFDEDGRLTFNIQIFSAEGSGSFDQRVISTRLWPMTCDLLAIALETAGFTSLTRFGDLEGSGYDPQASENLVITAKARSFVQ